VIQQTSIPNLAAFAGLNYGRGHELGGGGSSPSQISYTSYGGSGGMSYKVTPKTFVVLTYRYLNFDNRFGPQRVEFDKNMVQLVLTQALY
jgi:opacity protein-like surface antigen